MSDLHGAIGKVRASTAVPIAGEGGGDSRPPSRVRKWGTKAHLSSAGERIEAFLADRAFERMPWLAVAMLAGIGLWFLLPAPDEWLIALGICGLIAGMALIWSGGAQVPVLRSAIIGVAMMVAFGLTIIWARSSLIGTEPISGPRVANIEAVVLEREEQPARNRARLVVATRDPMDGRSIRARLNVPVDFDRPELQPGTQFGAKVRLAPPQRAAVPGGYDFARISWFEGLAATGSLLERPAISDGRGTGGASWRNSLAAHTRARTAEYGGSASAAIAATLITGDRGAIPESDAQAMRDAGLAHMLSISGLHVGAIIALAWVLIVRIGALFPWLALRVSLPLAGAGGGAIAGISYTVLTGAALPTVRACLAALLVLAALALGRQALSLRLIALAAMAVMLFWPEAVIGPSFQLSFAAVIAIVAFHNSRFVEQLTQKRGDGRLAKAGHAILLLFLTGLVVEVTLSPLVLFHFQRSGVYGSVANVIAIPLMTAVILPSLIAALIADLVGLGAPFWWLGARSLDLIVALANGTAGMPGSVLKLPMLPFWAMMVCLAGGFWLALWSGKTRLLGLAALVPGFLAILFAAPPDLLIDASGRNAAISDAGGDIYMLRNSSSFASDVMVEAMGGQPGSGHGFAFSDWPGANCNGGFCELQSNGRTILAALTSANVSYAPLIAACARADVVISSRRLPAECRPRMLKADGSLLSRRGGLAVDLESGHIRAVRPEGDRHGW